MLLFDSIGLIIAVQQHGLEGGLTSKVYWRFGFRTSQKFSIANSFPTIDKPHMNHFRKWGKHFVACSCRKYQANLCTLRISIHFWTRFLAVGALQF